MKKYILFLLVSLTIYIGHTLATKHAIYGDGNGYYATTQSVLYDHTLNSPKILIHLKNFPGKNYIFSRVFWDEKKNPYSVGTSIIWLPLLALVSLFSQNRFDLLHELAPGIAGIISMLVGLYYLEKYLLYFWKPRAACWTIVSLFLGSNIFYYTAFEPALSHQPAFCIIALLLYWTHTFQYSRKNLVLLGGVCSLLSIVRISDTVLLLPILVNLKYSYKRIFWIILGAILGLLPQLYAQFYYFGSIFKNFYVTESTNQWSFNIFHLREYLFSLKRGLFTWSPLYLLGCYGLMKMGKKVIIISVVLLWIIGATWSAYSSAGFGQRLSFSAVPYFALGIAAVYDQLSCKKQVFLTLLFALYNVFLLYGFYILKWKNV